MMGVTLLSVRTSVWGNWERNSDTIRDRRVRGRGPGLGGPEWVHTAKTNVKGFGDWCVPEPQNV